jgi:Ser/Thr protein kinase RdoA (MazF antagonist)
MKTETTVISEQLQKSLIDSIGLNPQNIRFIGYSQNFLYEISDVVGAKILRITSDKHRTKNQIIAELQWIDFLKNGGVNACAAIKENGQNVIHSFETPTDTLHCVLFEKAKGNPINIEFINDELYYLHGALVGKIHRLTHEYPTDITKNRFNWQDNRLYTTDLQEYLPDYAKRQISEISRELIGEALKLPQSNKTYGTIHFDLHYGNFLIEEKVLYLFDFDNCSNGYFANDIAKVLWSSVFTYHRSTQFKGGHPFFGNPIVDQILESVWTPFWNGYRTENEIEESWFEQIPLFFELIHLKEFVHHYRHGVPYRNEELREIFAMEQKQIEQRKIPVCFDFKRGKALTRGKTDIQTHNRNKMV